MGRRVEHYSDLSGEPIPGDRPPTQVYIVFSDRRRGVCRLELTEQEANELSQDRGHKLEPQTANRIQEASAAIVEERRKELARTS